MTEGWLGFAAEDRSLAETLTERRPGGGGLRMHRDRSRLAKNGLLAAPDLHFCAIREGSTQRRWLRLHVRIQSPRAPPKRPEWISTVVASLRSAKPMTRLPTPMARASYTKPDKHHSDGGRGKEHRCESEAKSVDERPPKTNGILLIPAAEASRAHRRRNRAAEVHDATKARA